MSESHASTAELRKVRHQYSDAQWRANIARCYQLLKPIVDHPLHKDGLSKGKRNIASRIRILEATSTHIKFLETLISTLLAEKSRRLKSLNLTPAYDCELMYYKNHFANYLQTSKKKVETFSATEANTNLSPFGFSLVNDEPSICTSDFTPNDENESTLETITEDQPNADLTLEKTNRSLSLQYVRKMNRKPATQPYSPTMRMSTAMPAFNTNKPKVANLKSPRKTSTPIASPAKTLDFCTPEKADDAQLKTFDPILTMVFTPLKYQIGAQFSPRLPLDADGNLKITSPDFHVQLNYDLQFPHVMDIVDVQEHNMPHVPTAKGNSPKLELPMSPDQLASPQHTAIEFVDNRRAIAKRPRMKSVMACKRNLESLYCSTPKSNVTATQVTDQPFDGLLIIDDDSVKQLETITDLDLTENADL